MDLEERIAIVERALAIYKAGEDARDKHLQRIENALFGKNGESGIVEDVRDMKRFKDKFVKFSLWVLTLIVAPVLGTLGFFIIKILAHVDEIMKALDYLEKISK